MNENLAREIATALASYETWSEERSATLEEESETGHLDHDRIWASDDDGTEGYGQLADLLQRVLKDQGFDALVPPPATPPRPTDTCGCGYDLVWVDGEWQHDAAESLWGGDHAPSAEPPTGERRAYWDDQDGFDTESSASRQHYIETGYHLRQGEVEA